MNSGQYHGNYKKASAKALEITRNEEYSSICQTTIDFVNCALRKTTAKQRFREEYLDAVLETYGSKKRDEVFYSLFLARQIVERTKNKAQRFSQLDETLKLLESGYNPQRLYLEREVEFQKRLRSRRDPETQKHLALASAYRENGRTRNLSPELIEVERADHPEVVLSELEDIALSLPHNTNSERRRVNRRNGGNGDRRDH